MVMVTHGHDVRRALRLRIADVPGALATVSARFAEHGIDIIRLEVLPGGDGDTVFDDVEVGAADVAAIEAAVEELRALGVEVIVLPVSWSVHDWVMEVFDALDRLETAETAGDELAVVLTAANRLAHTDRAVLLTESGDGDAERAMERWKALEEMAAAHPAGTVEWSGDAEAIRRIETALTAFGGAHTAAPARGLAISCDEDGSTVLAMVGDRPVFIPAEIVRVDRFARLAVRLAVPSRLAPTTSEIRAPGLLIRRLLPSDGPALAVIGRSISDPDGRGDFPVDRWVRQMLAAGHRGDDVVVLEVEGPFGPEAIGVGHADGSGSTKVSVVDDWEGTGAAELIRRHLDQGSSTATTSTG